MSCFFSTVKRPEARNSIHQKRKFPSMKKTFKKQLELCNVDLGEMVGCLHFIEFGKTSKIICGIND